MPVSLAQSLGQTFRRVYQSLPFTCLDYYNWHVGIALGHHITWKHNSGQTWLWWVWIIDAQFRDSLSRILGEDISILESKDTWGHRLPKYPCIWQSPRKILSKLRDKWRTMWINWRGQPLPNTLYSKNSQRIRNNQTQEKKSQNTWNHWFKCKAFFSRILFFLFFFLPFNYSGF